MPKNTASKRFFQEKYFANVSKMLSLGGELLTHAQTRGCAWACVRTRAHTHLPIISFSLTRKLHLILFIIKT